MTAVAWNSPERLAAVVEATPRLGPPVEVLAAIDPRDNPDAEPTPQDHPQLGAKRVSGAPPIQTDPGKGEPLITLQRRGPSYVVAEGRTDLLLTFREVRTDRELSADVSVAVGRRHLFRTTSTLSLTGRDRLAKTAVEFAGGALDPVMTRRAIHRAAEAVLEAEERLGEPTDLRVLDVAAQLDSEYVLRPFWRSGPVVLTAPGEAGKSTIARAAAVSIAGGLSVLPGIEPVGDPRPVLYVAGEDPIAYWHARSIEAICRGLGVERRSLAQPIELFDGRGRPLHRIARALAERAADFGAVFLDSQQTLLAQVDASGGIRDRDSLYWNAVDQLELPVLMVSHPNRSDARDWNRVDDGRAAGSEVNRDRARMIWRAAWKDEPAVVGTSYRRYTLTNTKANHGPREAPLSFGAAWTFGYGGDPGELHFLPSDPVAVTSGAMSTELAETLEAYRAGHTTPAPLAKELSIGVNTAKSRLRLLRERGLLEEVTSAS